MAIKQFDYQVLQASNKGAGAEAQAEVENIGKEIVSYDVVGLLNQASKTASDIMTPLIQADSVTQAMQGRTDARIYIDSLDGLTAQEKVEALEAKNKELINSVSNGNLSSKYATAYFNATDQAYTFNDKEAEKEYNAKTAIMISNEVYSNIGTDTTLTPDELVAQYKKLYPRASTSSLRDGAYNGYSNKLVDIYSDAITLDDIALVDNEVSLFKSQLSSNNFRGSNAKGTRVMVTNADARVKLARELKLKEIQGQYALQKAQLDTSVNTSNNITVTSNGDILIKPSKIVTTSDYADIVAKSGKTKDKVLLDTDTYEEALFNDMKIREEIEKYSTFTTPYNDLPLTSTAKKYLDESFNKKAYSYLIAGDNGSAMTIISDTQKTINIAPTLKSGIHSENLEEQKISLDIWTKLESDPKSNQLLHMLMSTDDISYFSSLTSMVKAGYSLPDTIATVDQAKALTDTGITRPLPTDLKESLDSGGEGMTNTQYKTMKKMALTMNQNGVDESIIEDYINDYKDKVLLKQDTTLTFGGFSVLNEGGIIPNVQEDTLTGAYEMMFSKVLKNNEGLTKDDLAIVIKPNSSDAVVVLKKDTSIVLSKGLTNLNDLTKAVQLKKTSPEYMEKQKALEAKTLEMLDRNKDIDAVGVLKKFPKFVYKITSGLALDTVKTVDDLANTAVDIIKDAHQTILGSSTSRGAIPNQFKTKPKPKPKPKPKETKVTKVTKESFKRRALLPDS